MSNVIQALAQWAATCPAREAVQGDELTLSWAALQQEVMTLAAQLDGQCLGLLLDNSPAWAVADLAALQRGIICVPLPPFFSLDQLTHTLHDAGVDLLLTDQPGRVELPGAVAAQTLTVAGRRLTLLRRSGLPARPDLHGIAKITYTSGTTGAPKGVCLPLAALEQVTAALCTATAASTADVSLALTPLATLLENIGGLYAPLCAGARLCLPALATVGLRGAAGLDVPALLAALTRFAPTTVILVPQMLKVLVMAAVQGWQRPASLRFMAVGGAPVAESLLTLAQMLGLPVYEGYGLSEATSVVSLNRPGAVRVGSVGRPLPHVRLRFTADGEIEVAGSLCAGYLHDPAPPGEFWATGDLGYLDADGFLYLTGRRKNMFITAFGRNVAPEWVERELTAHPAILQAAVFGEGRPGNVAVIVARAAADVAEAVAAANARLPDYARISGYLLAAAPFSVANGQLTGTGRPRREALATAYAAALEELYDEEIK